jgi:hypothetical protein
MAPTPTQIATWKTDCSDYNRTLTAWQSMQPQLADFNTLLAKNNPQPLKLSTTAPASHANNRRPAVSVHGPSTSCPQPRAAACGSVSSTRTRSACRLVAVLRSSDFIWNRTVPNATRRSAAISSNE